MPYLKTLIAGPFGTNCYLVGADDTDKVVLIDAPPDCRDQVARTLRQDKKTLAALLITHPHFDHTVDTGLFASDGIPVYAHAEAEEGIRKPDTLGLIPFPPQGIPEEREIHRLAGGDEIESAGLKIRCFDVPGHSNGSLAFYIPDLKACFVGDVLFQGSIGRTDLPGGDFGVISDSIRNVLYVLSDDTRIYPGHGPQTTVGDEKRGNPFVRG